MCWQGRIKHDKLEGVDPTGDFLAAAALSPARAEPLIWLCWHYHAQLERCGEDDRVCHLQNRVAAYYYAKQAAALPYPPGVRHGSCVQCEAGHNALANRRPPPRMSAG